MAARKKMRSRAGGQGSRRAGEQEIGQENRRQLESAVSHVTCGLLQQHCERFIGL